MPKKCKKKFGKDSKKGGFWCKISTHWIHVKPWMESQKRHTIEKINLTQKSWNNSALPLGSHNENWIKKLGQITHKQPFIKHLVIIILHKFILAWFLFLFFCNFLLFFTTYIVRSFKIAVPWKFILSFGSYKSILKDNRGDNHTLASKCLWIFNLLKTYFLSSILSKQY